MTLKRILNAVINLEINNIISVSDKYFLGILINFEKDSRVRPNLTTLLQLKKKSYLRKIVVFSVKQN